MNIIPGITILLLFQLFGETIVIVFQLPVPGPVLGMLALLTTLVIHKGWQGSLEPVSQAILRHFSLLFVPAGVGVILHFQRFENEWFAIGAALFISTLIALIATAFLTELVVRSRHSTTGQSTDDV
jgi:holin-like protein